MRIPYYCNCKPIRSFKVPGKGYGTLYAVEYYEVMTATPKQGKIKAVDRVPTIYQAERIKYERGRTYPKDKTTIAKITSEKWIAEPWKDENGDPAKIDCFGE